mgnify:CR=1 FL=1
MDHQSILRQAMDQLGMLYFITSATHLTEGERQQREAHVSDHLSALCSELQCEECVASLREAMMGYRQLTDRIAFHMHP